MVKSNYYNVAQLIAPISGTVYTFYSVIYFATILASCRDVYIAELQYFFKYKWCHLGQLIVMISKWGKINSLMAFFLLPLKKCCCTLRSLPVCWMRNTVLVVCITHKLLKLLWQNLRQVPTLGEQGDRWVVMALTSVHLQLLQALRSLPRFLRHVSGQLSPPHPSRPSLHHNRSFF